MSTTIPSATVMLIDDSEVVRMQAGRALLDAGFSVIEAVDGLDAMRKLEAAPSDVALIVCDVNMPRMDGLEFVAWLATQTARPPILMLTTEGHPQLIQRAKDNGAKGWMVKPLKPELLVAAARRLTKS
jgi:two-component system, chemotaxis family, chemotaxis protein CheY